MTRRVTVNGAILARGTSGSATVTRLLIDGLRLLPDADVDVVSPGPVRGRYALVNAVGDASWDLYRSARTGPRAALHVSPCNIGRSPAAVPHLLVVHDVMVLDRPRDFDAAFAAYFTRLMPYSLRRADRVVVTTERTRARVRALAPAADVHVIALPASRPLGPPRRPPAEPTVLMVGATEPHKNQVSGIRAVADLRRRTGAPVRLRHIGPAGRAEAAVRTALDEVDAGRFWTTRESALSTAGLAEAYDTAWLLLQPSYDEGYGLPLVEAAAAGVPVLHSGGGAMSEVLPAGDVGGATAEDFLEPMRRLLDGERWSRASAEMRVAAGAFSVDRFQVAVRSVVEPMLATSAAKRVR